MPGSLMVFFEVGGGKAFPTFPAHAQPAILRIWQEAHDALSLQTKGMRRRCLLSLDPGAVVGAGKEIFCIDDLLW